MRRVRWRRRRWRASAWRRWPGRAQRCALAPAGSRPAGRARGPLPPALQPTAEAHGAERGTGGRESAGTAPRTAKVGHALRLRTAPRTALLAGATGLVGRALLAQLLLDTRTSRVQCSCGVRRGHRGPRQAADAQRQLQPPAPRCPSDDVYIALGTTIKVAGSRAAFRQVDRDYVLATARAARAAGARRIAVVSALGADRARASSTTASRATWKPPSPPRFRVHHCRTAFAADGRPRRARPARAARRIAGLAPERAGDRLVAARHSARSPHATWPPHSSPPRTSERRAFMCSARPRCREPIGVERLLEHSLWRHRAFMRFWFARLAGTAANQMLMVALGWQMYDLTGSAWDLGLVGLLQFLPALLLVLVAGHVVDRTTARASWRRASLQAWWRCCAGGRRARRLGQPRTAAGAVGACSARPRPSRCRRSRPSRRCWCRRRCCRARWRSARPACRARSSPARRSAASSTWPARRRSTPSARRCSGWLAC